MTPPDPRFWHAKRVLVTGHTGFKGSWLCLWLQSMGSEVHGLSLDAPTTPNLHDVAAVERHMSSSTVGDIRDLPAVQRCMTRVQPEVVIHMAAQSLVRLSYEEPVATYATNVMGTVHVLEAARQAGSVRAVVAVTTDKCYENREWVWGYRENEPLGGHDPYSSSKGCSELVASAYRRSFFSQGGLALATARAGNVIGGGDWAVDRLIPDVLRAFARSEAVVIRHPLAFRPWQHVLEPLSGYLALAERLWESPAQFAEAWNFGPIESDARSVHWIVASLAARWGTGAGWRPDDTVHPHEARFLKLDISKAAHRLGWRPRWTLDTALQRIVEWHRSWLAGEAMSDVCQAQISEYTKAHREFQHVESTHS